MSNSFRARRHARFLHLVASLPRPLSILDLGGTVRYWRTYGVLPDSQITLVNLRAQVNLPLGFAALEADACDLYMVADSEYDLVFSNSCIEHVGDWAHQRAFAREARRVGRCYWIQTPARSFPLEPHFYLPWFAYWPMALRRAVLRTHLLPCWRGQTALDECARIRLLTAKEVQTLFPNAALWRERIGPFTKSYVVYTP